MPHDILLPRLSPISGSVPPLQAYSPPLRCCRDGEAFNQAFSPHWDSLIPCCSPQTKPQKAHWSSSVCASGTPCMENTINSMCVRVCGFADVRVSFCVCLHLCLCVFHSQPLFHVKFIIQCTASRAQSVCSVFSTMVVSVPGAGVGAVGVVSVSSLFPGPGPLPQTHRLSGLLRSLQLH